MEKCREKVETAAQQTELLSEEAVEQMSNQELLFLYRESGDEELKWKLVLRMTGMVRAIAAQVWGIYSSFAQLDDIVEEGILVLLSAVDKFDPSKDVKFETYVSKRLRGMIVDLARHQDWLPRQVRQKSIRLNRDSMFRLCGWSDMMIQFSSIIIIQTHNVVTCCFMRKCQILKVI